MNQLKEDIAELVKKHNNAISLTKLMLDYFDLSQKHLYLEVMQAGYESIPHFLTKFDEFSVKLGTYETFDIHMRPTNESEQELFGIPIKVEKPEPTSSTSNAVMRSYSTVKEEDQPSHAPQEASSETRDSEAIPTTVKRPKKFRRRVNRSTPPPYRPTANRARTANTPPDYQNNFLSQYYQSYSNLTPFDYRNWTGGQRYYNDAPDTTSTSQPYYMSNTVNPWTTSVLPFSYNPTNNPVNSYWNSSYDQQNKQRRNRY
ncbi:uncharacterized protein LOC134836941 [Culicoides brevitarsis]|uniref:uncharacterized protein LOC134836941 n=1 Tax=Culicoides brevitarsis TaxID=469753 RepID=UPI00307BC71D